jgi:iron complex transport system permease protein
MGFKRKWVIINSVLIILLILSIAICTAIGQVDIPVTDVFRIILYRISIFHPYIEPDFPDKWSVIIWESRLPRVLTGVLVGVALASSGTAMQGLFKNPLADPFIIGVSAGAALGAALVSSIAAAYLDLNLSYVTPLSAFGGALLAVFLVYNIAKERDRISVTNLLLAGIAVNMFFSAITSMLIYIYINETKKVIFWLLGSLGAKSWTDIQIIAPIIILGVIVMIRYSKDLNIMLSGDNTAMSLGVDVNRVKKIVLFFATLVTAAAVTVSGVIGFVGLIIPHIMRLIVGPDHRILLPASALTGGIFLIFCDVIARTALDQGEIPVALVTSLLGGPFFIYLLWRRKRVGEAF